jgi:hypothetical protein
MSRSRIVCVLLALITLSVYWPTRHYEFIACDDDEYVTGNRTDRISGGNSAAIAGTLAAAYAETGRFDAAVAAVRRALRLASARTVTDEMNVLTTQLNCYEAAAPFRDARLRRGGPSDPAAGTAADMQSEASKSKH